MFAMFWNMSCVLIFVDRDFDKCAIWLWMYWRNVMDVQRNCFWIMVSETPCSFCAIAPPARRECTPTRSGSMPFSSNLRVFTLTCTPCLIWDAVMVFHTPAYSCNQIGGSLLFLRWIKYDAHVVWWLGHVWHLVQFCAWSFLPCIHCFGL